MTKSFKVTLLWIVPLAGFVCAFLSFKIQGCHVQTYEPTGVVYNNELLHALIKVNAQSVGDLAQQYNEQRNLLKGWTITILAGLIGLGIGKNEKILFWCAIAVWFFMHSLDTFLLDWSDRAVRYNNEMTLCLVSWDTSDAKGIAKAESLFVKGLNDNNEYHQMRGWVRKIAVFFAHDLWDDLWWWGTFGLTWAAMWWMCYIKKPTKP